VICISVSRCVDTLDRRRRYRNIRDKYVFFFNKTICITPIDVHEMLNDEERTSRLSLSPSQIRIPRKKTVENPENREKKRNIVRTCFKSSTSIVPSLFKSNRSKICFISSPIPLSLSLYNLPLDTISKDF
jgi:hypothetical protein